MTEQRLPWRRGLLAGAITAALILCGGIAWAVTYRPAYTATATLLVLPSAGASRSGDAASYYDTLSQGQIVQTFAQVLRGGVRGAAGADVSVTAVPNTSVISIAVRDGDPRVAERIAAARAAAAPHTLNTLDTPYRTVAVDDGTGSAERTGTGRGTLLVAVAAVAVLAGVGAQQLVWLLSAGTRRATHPGPTSRPAPAGRLPTTPHTMDGPRHRPRADADLER